MNTNYMPDLPLMVLPGLMCDSRMFAGQTGSIAEVVVIDGFYEGASSLEAMADHALAHMPGRANLLGHSMGARIALEIMRKAPDRVARLALAKHDWLCKWLIKPTAVTLTASTG